MKSLTYLLPILMLSHSSLSVGGDRPPAYQSHDSIVMAAETYLKGITESQRGNVVIEISPPDQRLRLNRCEGNLEAFSPPGANSMGKTTVGVRCTSHKPWTLYVSANVSHFQPVVVTARNLSRGAVIKSTDVVLSDRDTTDLLRGYYGSTTEVIGNTLKRHIKRNQVLTPTSLMSQKTIKRGQSVTILAGNETVRVRMKGKALRNGDPGDLIPVQNLNSKRKLEARVVSEGTVRIDR